MLCLEEFLTLCLLYFGLLLLLCLYEVIDFGLSNYVIFEEVAIFPVLSLFSLLLFLQLLLHFLPFDVGFLLLDSQLLNFKLLSFNLTPNFIHKLFLFQFVLNLPDFHIFSAARYSVIRSLIRVETLSNQLVSFVDDKFEFLFSPFFEVLKLNFKTFLVIHSIVVDLFHMLEILDDELFSLNALSTTCFNASGAIK